MSDSIVDSIMNNPEDWKQGEHTFKNKKLNIQIWTSKVTFMGINTYPNKIPMSLTRRFRISRAIKWWADNAPIEALKVG